MNRFFLALCGIFCLWGSAAHADLIKQAAAYNRTVLMTSSADHVTGATGLTLTVTASKAGAAYASITPTVTELGNGVYSLALATGSTGTLGALDLHVTATGADPSDTHDQIVAFDPNDASIGVLGATVDGTLTVKNVLTVLASIQGWTRIDGALNPTAHTQTVTYKNQAGTTVAVATVTYAADNKTTTGRTVVLTP